MTLTRRKMLTTMGCCLAASPLVTPVTLAAAPGDNRLVVIILRGAMDGLDVLRPVGDPDFAALRPDLDADTLPLDGFFGLHPTLVDLMPLWQAGELGAVHATSTPYRDKRSHFDGQDLLEAGIAPDGRIRDGWLNRALALLPGATSRTGFAVGQGEMLVMHGEAPVSSWSPGSGLLLTPQAQRLLGRMYHDHPLFNAALDEAIMLTDGALPADGLVEQADMMGSMEASTRASGRGIGARKLAAFAAEQLRGDSRIAAFSLTGWDTHNNQAGAIQAPLKALAGALLTLREGLGPLWERTAVMAMTEFGRTARQNGSRGTDHGTGGAMILAGGAVRGGQVHGDWPGLGEAELYDRRDLMPTSDIRAQAGTVLSGLFGLSQADLETRVFPGIDLSEGARLLR